MSEDILVEQSDGDIQFEDTQEDDPLITTSFTPMRFDTLQRKVKDLLSDYNSKDLDPRPSFQRGYVWDKVRASKLVESVLLNVPLPLVYTAKGRGSIGGGNRWPAKTAIDLRIHSGKVS